MKDKPESRIRPEVAQMLEHDIEQKQEQPTIIQIPELPDQPHDSAYVHSQLKGRHTMVVFPTLDTGEKGKGHTIVIAMLILLVVLSAWGTAYEVQIQFTPHIIGTCAAPAVIQSGGCFIVQTSTDAQGNTHTTLVPAGTLNT